MGKNATKAALLAAVGMLALAGCTTAAPRPSATSPSPVVTSASASESLEGFASGSTIGASFPSVNPLGRETLAGERLRDQLTAAGFVPDVQYASGEQAVAEQEQQIRAMTDEGARVIFVEPVDGRRLSGAIRAAQAAGITVIAIDYGLGSADAVDYLLSFDPYEIGVLQGESLLDGLAQRAPGESPWNVEIFSGAMRGQARQFYDGAMSVLEPRIDDGTLVVVSGQTSLEETANGQDSDWNPDISQLRMDGLLEDFYDGVELDGVLAPNDATARAILASLSNAGRPAPVITGQDSDPESVVLMMAGEQYSTIYKDLSLLVPQAVVMVEALAAGIAPEVYDPGQFNASAELVPAYLLDAVLVTADNAAEVYRDDPALLALTQP